MKDWNPGPQPSPSTTISIFDLAQLRVALEQIKEPSPDIVAAIAKLDGEIRHFTDGLKH